MNLKKIVLYHFIILEDILIKEIILLSKDPIGRALREKYLKL